MNFDWFTVAWLMKNLNWAVGILVVGIIILFFFPLLLGYQLKNEKTKNKLDE
tara:strand:- start:871 stop:1026 length:156 start_codon:yes stop_codon:yes gene_type:complete